MKLFGVIRIRFKQTIMAKALVSSVSKEASFWVVMKKQATNETKLKKVMNCFILL